MRPVPQGFASVVGSPRSVTMALARRCFVSIALTSSVVAFLAAAVCVASVEVYPGPGIDTYKSNLYTVEVFDGSAWQPAYVYGFTRLSQCHWHYGSYPTANFLTFGTTGSGLPSFPKWASNSSTRASRFSLELNS